ncbi:hypothetical protein BT63DRAFT_333234 [Microthyrium microscopicum]|uniref:Nuclear pore complex subunit Nup192 n=1 Tax=Microthyrium microscopicum TaxID=703497 RepID=A0A6A6U6F0_9PEZI|nr:hypothetical protein BT63DRAFT_333234 [Microthyrium microscopicum]
MSTASLESLEALHHDLDALQENRFHIIDRLSGELEAHIEEFQNLLDHRTRNNASAVPGANAKIEIDNVEYEVNEDFRNQSLQLADELNLDERESAKLLLLAQDDARDFDRTAIVSAIMRFHRRRQYLLECIRLLFHLSTGALGEDDSEPEDDQDQPQPDLPNENRRITALLDVIRSRVIGQGSSYLDKLFNAVKEVESGLQKVGDRTQRAAVVGQALSRDEEQIMEYERDTLNIQHESLSAIITLYIGLGRMTSTNILRQTLARLQTLDKHDLVLLHYVPVIMKLAAKCISGGLPDHEIGTIHTQLMNKDELDRWASKNLCHTVRAWWIVSYKGRYTDDETREPVASPEGDLLDQSLRNGGLHFMLSVAQDVKKGDWRDPAKLQLTSFLLGDTARLAPETPSPTEPFQEMVMDLFQNFIHDFISNMPDTLRLLKFQEDDQRRLLRSRFQNNTSEYRYDLDRFLVLISYAYQDYPDSARDFWIDSEGHMYGFLQWAAKRQTTPRVAAFCEMLRSLSEGEICADNTHQFLLDEGAPVAGKLRRTTSLSWSQIFAELEFYATQIRERQAVTNTGNAIDAQHAQEQLIEPESNIMLECYLRLVSHLCGGSAKVRNWLLQNEANPIAHILFQLISTSADSKIRAWCFMTLAALTVDKNPDTSAGMWEKLDLWISGAPSTAPTAARSAAPPTTNRPEPLVLDHIASGFEEPHGFMHLLNGLVIPGTNELGLNDELPFPENLGSSYRLPGISTYIDFALGRVFADGTMKLSDTYQANLLRLTCLDFICTCLSSFNEDLVIIANRSNMPVERIIRSSSLESYVLWHPFSRVMEHLFDDKCLKALFAAAKQDPQAINLAASNSPLVLSLVRSIEAMNLILKFQSMYFDVVRPFIRKMNPDRKPVSQSLFPSFEDAVLKDLSIIVNLGLYCGLGHSELTLCSLALLEKLSSSRKLSYPVGQIRADRSKLITQLEQDNEAERISRGLMSSMTIDEREIEVGPLASGYSIKSGIISFLKSTLLATPDRPNIAHLLLGFNCTAHSIYIENQDAFANGSCLFFAIGRLVMEYPNRDGANFLAWSSNITQACTEILRILWRSPLTSQLVLTQLRESDYAFLQALRQMVIGTRTIWSELMIADPAFFITDSALALRNFLHQRTAYFDFLAREFRYCKVGNVTSLLLRLQAVLLGSAHFPGQAPQSCPNIFELFDFMELDYSSPGPIVDSAYIREADFVVCQTTRHDEPPGPLFDLPRAEEIILLQRNEFTKDHQPLAGSKELVKTPAEDLELLEFNEAANNAFFSILARNQWREVVIAQAETLKSWTQLMVVAIETCQFEPAIELAFVHQAYQLIVPKFEKAVFIDIKTAVELATLLLTLLKSSKYKNEKDKTPNGSTNGKVSTTLSKSNGRMSVLDNTNDIEFQVFRAALNASVSSTSNVEFREVCYQVCCQYLRNVSGDVPKGSIRRRNILRTIKQVNDRLIEIAADDACNGRNSCGIGALLLLESLVSVSAIDDPKLILSGLESVNFVAICVDCIRRIPVDLREAAPEDVPLVFGYHNACLALLVRIAQTRPGAVQVLNAGLFSAVEDSQIFSTDPDVGLELNNQELLKKFFDLMVSVLRIVNSVVLKFQSDQTIGPARDFLSRNRNSVIGILKRHDGVGGIEMDSSINLSDLVDNITLLMAATDYLEFESVTTDRKRTMMDVFT